MCIRDRGFTAGILILLQGVRMFLGELVPAFKGISDKLVTGAIPALDVPALFGYAPNSLMIGFITSVSYTHLDVYKRQLLHMVKLRWGQIRLGISYTICAPPIPAFWIRRNTCSFRNTCPENHCRKSLNSLYR